MEKQKQRGDYIYRLGDKAQFIYRLISGEAIKIDGDKRRSVKIGEVLGLNEGTRYRHSVMSLGCTYIEYRRNDYMEYFAEEMMQIREKSEFLRIHIFTNLGRESLEQITPHFNYITFKKDQWLYKQGDVLNLIYIIKSGTVQVFKESSLACLESGEMFGHEEFVLESPKRVYSIRCVTLTHVYVIEIHQMMEFLKSKELLDQFMASMKKQIQWRLHKQFKYVTNSIRSPRLYQNQQILPAIVSKARQEIDHNSSIVDSSVSQHSREPFKLRKSILNLHQDQQIQNQILVNQKYKKQASIDELPCPIKTNRSVDIPHGSRSCIAQLKFLMQQQSVSPKQKQGSTMLKINSINNIKN